MKGQLLKWNLQFFGDSEAGAEVQEVAEPDATKNQSDSTEGDVSGNNPDEPVDNKQEDDEDARFAAVRRKAEYDAKVKYDAQIAEYNKKIQNVFGGLQNPKTGQPVQNIDDYINAVQAQNRSAIEGQMKEKGIDPQLIENMIRTSPEIIQAQQILEQNQKAEADRMLERDLKSVSAIDPSIQSMDDLSKHESFQTILGYVNNGLNLVDAFKLANYESLTSKKSEAAKQAAINAAKSTSHMATTPSGNSSGDGLVDIPGDEISTWRDYFPGLSDSELKKKYNETL